MGQLFCFHVFMSSSWKWMLSGSIRVLGSRVEKKGLALYHFRSHGLCNGSLWVTREKAGTWKNSKAESKGTHTA